MPISRTPLVSGLHDQEKDQLDGQKGIYSRGLAMAGLTGKVGSDSGAEPKNFDLWLSAEMA